MSDKFIKKIENERDLRRINQVENIRYILNQYSQNRPFFIKGDETRQIIQKVVVKDEYIMLSLPEDYELKGDTLILYGISKRYVQFKLRLIKHIFEKRYFFQVLEVYIANVERKEERFEVNSKLIKLIELQILPTNDQLLYNSQNQVVIDILFEKFKQKLLKYYSNVDINSFTEISDQWVNFVKIQRKILMISDIHNIHSYFHKDKKIISYDAYRANNFEQDKSKLIKLGLKSLLIYPFMLNNSDGENIPYCYCKIWSRTDTLKCNEIILELQQISYDFFDQLKKLLATDFSVEDEQVLNISFDGMCICTKDKKLNQLLLNNNEFLLKFNFILKPHNFNPLIFKAVVRNQSGNENKLTTGLVFINSHDDKFIRLERYINIWQASLKKDIKQEN